jgi:hypothetical protein
VNEREEHRRHLSTLIELEPAVHDDVPGIGGHLRRLCSTVTRTLPATWAGVSLIEDGQVGGAIAGNDAYARELEALQFNLGEGPCVDSVHARRPVLESDLRGSGYGRWPAYAREAYKRGARGVFAFPLQAGAVCVGALDVYQDRSQELPPQAIASALTFAELALEVLLDEHALSRDGDMPEGVGDAMAPRMVVYQAQGMLTVDLGVGLAEAMARLRAHAFVEGRPLADVARDIVEGRLRLEP